jgi:membrane-bound lytic murein transglycosylase B
MRLVLRALGGGVVAACALSLSGAVANPTAERVVQFVPTVASVTRVAPDGSVRDVTAELGDPASAEDSVVTAQLITDDVLTGDEEQTSLAISPRDLNIPELVLRAYQRAANEAPDRCGLRWEVLAGIGKIESNHARGGRLTSNGDTVTPIVGPVLNGSGPVAAISDSDNGRWDGDPVWDRAVGPMQFIPGTWQRFATDGNDDGTANPHNVWDAAASAAAYLCAGGADLSTDAGLRSALLRYNRSTAYVNNVIRWINAYAGGEVVAVGSTGGGGSTSSRDGSASSTTSRDPQPIAKPTSPPSTNGNGSNSSGGSDGGSSTQDPVRSPSISPKPPTSPPPTTEPPTSPPPTTEPPPEPEPVAVPQVVGKTQAEAVAALESAGLAVAIQTAASSEVPEGNVISSDPAAGTSLNPGSTVTIVVSTGPELVAIPDVSGQSEADAVAALEGAGFSVEVQSEDSLDVAGGVTIRTEPTAGDAVQPGSPVTLVVSAGEPEPEPTSTPTSDGDPARETDPVTVVEGEESDGGG